MQQQADYRYLLKFLVASASSFFVGSVHGVLQVLPPIRAWLDSIGSPYGGPGHMIDPLAHAHINLIGGVTLLCVATTYYLLSKVLDRPLYSIRLANHSFWWTTIGIYSFYTTLMVFGTWEGQLLLAHSPDIDRVHDMAIPIIAGTASVMGIGLWMYLLNVFLTLRNRNRTPS
jgi:cytochrome c oxidase cbb3-type subunit 1